MLGAQQLALYLQQQQQQQQVINSLLAAANAAAANSAYQQQKAVGGGRALNPHLFNTNAIDPLAAFQHLGASSHHLSSHLPAAVPLVPAASAHPPSMPNLSLGPSSSLPPGASMSDALPPAPALGKVPKLPYTFKLEYEAVKHLYVNLGCTDEDASTTADFICRARRAAEGRPVREAIAPLSSLAPAASATPPSSSNDLASLFSKLQPPQPNKKLSLSELETQLERTKVKPMPLSTLEAQLERKAGGAPEASPLEALLAKAGRGSASSSSPLVPSTAPPPASESSSSLLSALIAGPSQLAPSPLTSSAGAGDAKPPESTLSSLELLLSASSSGPLSSLSSNLSAKLCRLCKSQRAEFCAMPCFCFALCKDCYDKGGKDTYSRCADCQTELLGMKKVHT